MISLTNLNAMRSAAAMSESNADIKTSMERLSTGSRINAASDDAAGLAIATEMNSQIIGMAKALDNAADGANLMITADGALNEVHNLLQRMRELAMQAANGTQSDGDLTSLNDEYQSMKSEIARIGANTEWNGKKIFDGVGFPGETKFQVGAISNQTIGVSIDKLETSELGKTTTTNVVDVAHDDSPPAVSFTANIFSPHPNQAAITTATSLRYLDMLTLDATETQQEIGGTMHNVKTLDWNSLVSDIQIGDALTYKLGGAHVSGSVDEDDFSSVLEGYVSVLDSFFIGDGIVDGNVTHLRISHDSSWRNHVHKGYLSKHVKATEIDFNNKGLEAADRITIQVDGIPAQSVTISETGLNTALEALRNSAIAAGAAAEDVAVDNGVLRFMDRSSYPSLSATIETGIDIGNLDFAGITFSAGDKIKLALADGSTLTGSVATGGLAATLSDLANQIKAKSSMFSDATVNGSQLVVTGLVNGSPLGSIDVSLTKEGFEVLNLATSSITSGQNANLAISVSDQALQDIGAARAKYGATSNLLIHAIDNLSSAKSNAQSSLSKIADADYAQESSNLALAQIRNQGAKAMLAQANTDQELTLQLIEDWL